MTRLSEDARKRLHAAVSAAEARSSARFACVVLPASDRYALYPLLFGTFMALALGAGLALFAPHLALRDGVVAEAALFAVAAFAADWFPLRLLLVPGRVKREHARVMAHREFAARILAPAARREGVLLFVSLGEHYVEIVATQDVHAKVGEAAWNAIVADFVAAAKAGRIADGAIAAIAACAERLAPHFPAKP